ncbi:MAG: PadR family transcriptional regulator [Candidatus Thorarchaeota archaeon]|nr:PadR family transcriptional regulator [Candidatus Thorarchaeota archaeon]
MNEIQDNTVDTQDEMSGILSDFSQFYILLLLSEGPKHGYGLIKEFRNRTRKTLSAGTVYPFLRKLEERELISKVDMSGGKRSKLVYSLTVEGRKFTDRLFQRFASMTASAIEPSLDVCVSCGVRIYEGGYHEEIKGQLLAFCCSHCAAAFKRQQ